MTAVHPPGLSVAWRDALNPRKVLVVPLEAWSGHGVAAQFLLHIVQAISANVRDFYKGLAVA